jgi:hydroxymethylpyrimidine pyrophosphatase-like HAD family hydrolase
MAVGVGTADAVRSAETALRAHPEVGTHIESFAIGGTDQWLVRLRPPACNKAIGLASLAERMGLAPSQVATIGDWHNDLEMLKWSGWSFAVGHAPDEVKRAAKHPLESTALSGGAVAEAIAYLEGAQ